MSIETSGNTFGLKVFVRYKRIDKIQFSNIIFSCNRYSNPTSNLRPMGQSESQFLEPDGQWQSKKHN